MTSINFYFIFTGTETAQGRNKEGNMESLLATTPTNSKQISDGSRVSELECIKTTLPLKLTSNLATLLFSVVEAVSSRLYFFSYTLFVTLEPSSLL